jgi:hypothetical protein
LDLADYFFLTSDQLPPGFPQYFISLIVNLFMFLNVFDLAADNLALDDGVSWP